MHFHHSIFADLVAHHLPLNLLNSAYYIGLEALLSIIEVRISDLLLHIEQHLSEAGLKVIAAGEQHYVDALETQVKQRLLLGLSPVIVHHLIHPLDYPLVGSQLLQYTVVATLPALFSFLRGMGFKGFGGG